MDIPDPPSAFLDDCLKADLEARDAREAADPTLCTWHHARFGEFAERLAELRLDPAYDGLIALARQQWPLPGEGCPARLPVSALALEQLGGFDVLRSLIWLERHGGGCGDDGVLTFTVEVWKEGPAEVAEQERYRRADTVYHYGDRGARHRAREQEWISQHQVQPRTERIGRPFGREWPASVTASPV